MKKALCLFVSVFFVGASVCAHAKEDSPNFAKTSASTPAVKESSKEVSRPASAGKREDMKKRIEDKKKELNGSEWQVNLTTGGKEEGKDTLTFQNGQIKSKYFADKGFPATNYTISIADGSDMATWETMQTDAKGGVLFIRGEWDKDVMRGVMSQQLDENKTKDFNFSSASKEAIEPTTEPEKKAEEPAPALSMPPATAPTKEAPKADKFVEEVKKYEEVAVAPFNPGTTDESKNS